jgi:hypothetical protein
VPGRGTEVGDREQHGDQGGQGDEHADDQPGTRPAQHLDQLDSDHARASASRATCSRVRRYGPISSTRRLAPTRWEFSRAGSPARTSSRSPSTLTTELPSRATHRWVSVVRTATRPVGRSQVSNRSWSINRPLCRTPTWQQVRRVGQPNLGEYVAVSDSKPSGCCIPAVGTGRSHRCSGSGRIATRLRCATTPAAGCSRRAVAPTLQMTRCRAPAVFPMSPRSQTTQRGPTAVSARPERVAAKPVKYNKEKAAIWVVRDR